MWRTICMFVVALVWGCSNPFLKRGSEGVQQVRGNNWLHQLLLELNFLVTNCCYTVPFLINQSGSVLYYLTVARLDISLAVPIVNSLTVLFTAVVGLILGERVRSGRSYIGMALVLAGVTLCLTAKRTYFKSVTVDGSD